ncbi:MAG: MarR family transcriptional regulator [Clostridiales bacterium]|jgi:DNA-binding MarR family transcriptional regulator|nr:MarR family transcriptional regulator [Clostridiales bacterium]
MCDRKTGIPEKLSRAQWLFHQHHFRKHLVNGAISDPTRGQGRVLAILKMQPEISAKDLSYLLGIRSSSLNELLGKMEKKGYITRSQSNDDKRVVIVRLTEKGKNEEQKEGCSCDILNCLTDSEQKAFEEYLDRIIDNLEAQLGEDSDIFDWVTEARERFGENFDRMFSMRRGARHLRGCRHGGMDRGAKYCR